MALAPITRQEQIIAGKDLAPITRMERFLKEYGGASSWNDLTDKPFGSEGRDPIVSTDGFETAQTMFGPMLIASNDPITIDEIAGAQFTCIHPDTGDEVIISMEKDRIIDVGSYNGLVAGTIIADSAGLFVSIFADGEMVVDEETVVTFTKGFYLPNLVKSVTFPQTITPLDEKYMPILTSPSGKKFKLSVDDSGVLSATEVTE